MKTVREVKRMFAAPTIKNNAFPTESGPCLSPSAKLLQSFHSTRVARIVEREAYNKVLITGEEWISIISIRSSVFIKQKIYKWKIECIHQTDNSSY